MPDMVRQKVLDAAEKRMILFGYRKVTMDELAADLKMSKNTIYKYFRSKLQIAEGLLDRLKERINQQQMHVEKQYEDPMEILSQNIFYFQKELAPWFEYFLKDIKYEVPYLWEAFVTYRTEKILEIEDVIRKGIKKKEFRKINPTLAARAYLGAVNSILSPEVLEKEGISFESALRSIMDMWSEGILKRT
jgi:AcrR family transcriptional regulator